MNANLIGNGFIAAGLMNIGGVLFFSRVFTNEAINQADPVVMSNFGLLMIVVWGLAYWGRLLSRGIFAGWQRRLPLRSWYI
mgnify:CR=1 FL=1